jgi:phosphomevalonate kinase
VIVGDNDFYSQRAQVSFLTFIMTFLMKIKLKEKGLENTFDALASLDPFCKTHATLGTVHKTGLGSSAALTTSLVAGLLKHFGAVKTLSEDEDLCVVHNTAQLVHCYAQGKVGSGFDVSSAVYGSHRYNRFSPSVLKPMVVSWCH